VSVFYNSCFQCSVCHTTPKLFVGDCTASHSFLATARLFSFFTSAKEVMFLPDFVCFLSVCQQDNSKSYGRIFLKFSENVGNGKNY